MDINYVAPLQDEGECDYLRANYINCLKEKSVKDDVPFKRKCNVEQIIWFGLYCPDMYERDFWNPAGLRKTYDALKQSENKSGRKTVVKTQPQ